VKQEYFITGDNIFKPNRQSLIDGQYKQLLYD